MVNSCCVVGCSNRQNKEKGITLHRFPKYPSWRRNAWINAVNRLKPGSSPSKPIPWEPSNSTRICNKHFIEGKPSEDPSHSDFVPTQNLKNTQIVSPKAVARCKPRSQKKTSTTTNASDTTQLNESVAATALLDLSAQEDISKHTGTQTEPMEEIRTSFTKGRKQLPGKEVEISRKLSPLRIHMERVIGRMLDSTIPICQVHLLDDIITIIATLHNLMLSIVKN